MAGIFESFGRRQTAPDTKTGPALEEKASVAQSATFVYRTGTEQYQPAGYRNLIKRYQTNAIVRSATKLIAQSVAAIEPIPKIDEKESPRAAQAVKAYLKKPNPMQDRVGFIEDVVGHYVLKGDTFIEFVPGMPGYAEFYSLRPEFFTVRMGRNGFPAAYTYRPSSGASVEFPADIQRGKTNILHIKDFNPNHDIWGAGALEAAERSLATYDSAWDLALSLFKNSAMPAGALKFAPNVVVGQPTPRLSVDQRTNLRKMLDERTGPKNAGKPLILDGGLDWVQFSMNMVDLEAEQIRRAAMRDTALAFGVPPMLLGIPGDNTYANYSEASRAFYRGTVLPVARKIYGSVGRWFAGLTNMPGLELDIDEEKVWALSDELSMLWGRVQSSPILTTNEKREALGYDPVPLGDVLLLPAGQAPLQDIIMGDLGLYGDRSIAGEEEPLDAEVVDDGRAKPRQQIAPPKK